MSKRQKQGAKFKKHPCFGKKVYTNLRDVQKKIRSNYFRGNNAKGYYECPICLDFHLTKKGPQYKPTSKEVLEYFSLTSTQTKIDRRMELMKKHLKQHEENSIKERKQDIKKKWIQTTPRPWEA